MTEPEGPEVVPPTRWEIELEFVQSLSNPLYVNYLAQNKYLESPEFLKYLEYLEYWRKPENARYLVYPNCLHILSLLREERFRTEIQRADVAQMLMEDFYMKWLHQTGEPNAANVAIAEASSQ